MKQGKTRTESRVMYLLTLDGAPAMFDEQVCYLTDSGRGSVRATQCLLASKEECDAAIQATEKYRMRKGFGFDPKSYSYIRVRVPR